LYYFGDIVTYLPKFKDVWTLITPVSEVIYEAHVSTGHDESECCLKYLASPIPPKIQKWVT